MELRTYALFVLPCLVVMIGAMALLAGLLLRKQRLYWFRFEAPGLPVTMPALATKHFPWRRLCGVRVGSWFIGAIKGDIGEPYGVDSANPTPADGTALSTRKG